MAYESYKMMQSITSANPRERMLEDKKEQIEQLYEMAADREDNCKLNNEDFIKSPRIFNRKLKSGGLQVITVETILNNNNFIIGDMLFYDDKHWLCTDSYVFHELYCEGEFTLCNWILKFQSADGTILSYPCVDETTQRTGEKETVTVTLGDGVHSIKLPFDDNTVLLGADRRFFLSKHPTHPTPYQIIGDPNTTTYNYGNKGLIKLTVKQDELRAPDIDRVDLGVCDYFEPNIVPPDETSGSLHSTITSSKANNQITIGNTSGRTLTSVFYNKGVEVYDVLAKWSYEFPIGFEDQFIITLTADPNKIKISAKDNVSLIGKTVTVTVNDKFNDYKSSIVLTIVSGY